MAPRPLRFEVPLAVALVLLALFTGSVLGLLTTYVSDLGGDGVDGPVPLADRDGPPQGSDLGGNVELVVLQGADGDDVEGDVVVHYEGPVQGSRIVLVGPDGGRTVVAEGSTVAEWSSSEADDGFYRFQVERVEGGQEVVVAERTVRVDNPDSTPGSVVAASATGATVSAFTSMISSAVAQNAGVAVQAAKESLLGLGEDRLREVQDRIKAKRAASGRGALLFLAAAALMAVVFLADPHALSGGAAVLPLVGLVATAGAGVGLVRKDVWGLRSKVTAALVFAVAMVSVFFTFEEVDAVRWSAFATKLPLVAPVAGGFTVIALGGEWILGKATGSVSRFRIMWSGAITLVVSSVGFRTAFGYPGYIDEDVEGEEELPAFVEGLRAIGAIMAIPATLLPFMLVGMLWRYDVLDVAMNIGLAALAATAMPFRPMPGNDLWRWNRLVSVAFVVGAFTMFFGYELAFLTMPALLTIGSIGLVVYWATAVWLFARRQQAGWYKVWAARATALSQAIAAREPEWLQATRAAAGRMDAAVSRAGQATLRPVQAAVSKVTVAAMVAREQAALRRALRPEIRAAKAEVRTVFAGVPAHVRTAVVIDPETGEHRVVHRDLGGKP